MTRRGVSPILRRRRGRGPDPGAGFPYGATGGGDDSQLPPTGPPSSAAGASGRIKGEDLTLLPGVPALTPDFLADKSIAAPAVTGTGGGTGAANATPPEPPAAPATAAAADAPPAQAAPALWTDPYGGAYGLPDAAGSPQESFESIISGHNANAPKTKINSDDFDEDNQERKDIEQYIKDNNGRVITAQSEWEGERYGVHQGDVIAYDDGKGHILKRATTEEVNNWPYKDKLDVGMWIVRHGDGSYDDYNILGSDGFYRAFSGTRIAHGEWPAPPDKGTGYLTTPSPTPPTPRQPAAPPKQGTPPQPVVTQPPQNKPPVPDAPPNGGPATQDAQSGAPQEVSNAQGRMPPPGEPKDPLQDITWKYKNHLITLQEAEAEIKEKTLPETQAEQNKLEDDANKGNKGVGQNFLAHAAGSAAGDMLETVGAPGSSRANTVYGASPDLNDSWESKAGDMIGNWVAEAGKAYALKGIGKMGEVGKAIANYGPKALEFAKNLHDNYDKAMDEEKAKGNPNPDRETALRVAAERTIADTIEDYAGDKALEHVEKLPVDSIRHIINSMPVPLPVKIYLYHKLDTEVEKLNGWIKEHTKPSEPGGPGRPGGGDAPPGGLPLQSPLSMRGAVPSFPEYLDFTRPAVRSVKSFV